MSFLSSTLLRPGDVLLSRCPNCAGKVLTVRPIEPTGALRWFRSAWWIVACSGCGRRFRYTPQTGRFAQFSS